MRVLIVDDDEGFRSLARSLVDETPGLVTAADVASGEQAVEAAAEFEIDLVLMDVNMPGMGGIEATRRIVASEPQIRVVLTSCSPLEDLPPEVNACGAATFVPKSQLPSLIAGAVQTS